MIARTIPTTMHGRYLVEAPAARTSHVPLLVGCHGYAEGAEQMMTRLAAIPGTDSWCVVSVQGLNRFYQRRTDAVVAGWMTRQDREIAIADNIAYVCAVVDAVAREHGEPGTLVFSGFSQGVAMAFRAAASSPRPAAGVIAVGGDIPPEIDDAELARVRPVLLCRGTKDEWYTAETRDADVVRLRRAGVEPQTVEFDGGHEWSDPVARAAAGFLEQVWR